MTLIYTSKGQHRFDNPTKPFFAVLEAGSYPKLLIRDYLYDEVIGTEYHWNPPNRTDLGLKVEIHDLILSTWTLSSGVTNSTNNFTKTANEGYSGAYAAVVNAGNCSIEGKPGYILGNTAFCLQSGSVSYDYFNTTDVEHALVFNQTGLGFIKERGEFKAFFQWEVGDTGLVELNNGIVRYYQIKADKTKILLRSKRSLLSYPVTPTLVLYQVGAIANNVRIWVGNGANTSMDLIGVLEDFQDWQNPAAWESLAEKTMNKNKTEDFTYFSELKNVMTQSLNIAWDDLEKYEAFRDFWKWHDLDRPFIYKDAARHIEYFAQFVSAFRDNPLGADIFGMSADIRQTIDPPLVIPGA